MPNTVFRVRRWRYLYDHFFVYLFTSIEKQNVNAFMHYLYIVQLIESYQSISLLEPQKIQAIVENISEDFIFILRSRPIIYITI